MTATPFRILSIDGGGIRGLFPAACLAHIEQYTQKRMADHFDLLVGTSTGSIIALGLAMGVPAADILRFYEQKGPQIFPRGGRLKHWVATKYDNAPLVAALREVFGDATLNDLTAPVCVPSYELAQGWPRVFKDDHHPDLHWGGALPIWQVAAASSAAPTYFPPFQIAKADANIDGGIWANNPVLVAIAEAVRYFGQPLDNISVLSLGAGTRSFRRSFNAVASRGILGWARNFLDVVFDAQSKGADGIARMLISPEHYLRIDADLTDAVALDDPTAAEPLVERGVHAARMHKGLIEQRYLAWDRTTRPGRTAPTAS